MTAWFQPSALQARLSQADLIALSTGEGRAAAPDETVLQGVLDRAEVEVRGVLEGHALPATPEGILREICLDLAVEALYLRQKGMAAKIPEGWDNLLNQQKLAIGPSRMRNSSKMLVFAKKSHKRAIEGVFLRGAYVMPARPYLLFQLGEAENYAEMVTTFVLSGRIQEGA